MTLYDLAHEQSVLLIFLTKLFSTYLPTHPPTYRGNSNSAYLMSKYKQRGISCLIDVNVYARGQSFSNKLKRVQMISLWEDCIPKKEVVVVGHWRRRFGDTRITNDALQRHWRRRRRRCRMNLCVLAQVVATGEGLSAIPANEGLKIHFYFLSIFQTFCSAKVIIYISKR